ncbi:uncharacterized protein LOC108488159 [Gossypium arboreum]|uniref:uncharacterized protein LOC108488159 n=1 Tax=Gossypium arboreum TaxID=29729 RepID=UPI000819010E|nr:uncharacterized protein LOC108488159 [Gossypium arboreum]
MEEKRNLGLELVQEVEDKARLTSRHRDIEYQVGDKVFPKILPWKKVLRFEQKGNLSPRFIGPYEVAKWIGLVAYRLLLSPELKCIHDVFHIFMLRKYKSDPSHVVPVEETKVRSDLSYEEEPVAILD